MFDVSEIDRQHQQLVSSLNRLNEAVTNNEPRENIDRIIDDVISYTRMHFETEERLMILSGYPEKDRHVDKHEELIRDALHFREKLNYMEADLFPEWFHHWPFSRVLAHIQYADQQLEQHLAEADLNKSVR